MFEQRPVGASPRFRKPDNVGYIIFAALEAKGRVIGSIIRGITSLSVKEKTKINY
jgi:hypothetical protein